MRMWMINPDLMCIQHIAGEHRELHALKGSLERTKPEYENCEKHRKNLTALSGDGLIELKSLKERHDELVKYLDDHRTPIDEIPTLSHLPDEVVQAEVDRGKARRDLIDRSEACRPEGYCGSRIKSSGNPSLSEA